MTTQKRMKKPLSFSVSCRKSRLDRPAKVARVSKNVLAQQQMLKDMKAGTLNPDFVTDLVAPDMPNPFAEAMKQQ